MSDPEIPDLPILFPTLPAEMQVLAEDIRQMIHRTQEDMYLAGAKAMAEGICRVLCGMGMHEVEGYVFDAIAKPIYHRLHTSVEERRKL